MEPSPLLIKFLPIHLPRVYAILEGFACTYSTHYVTYKDYDKEIWWTDYSEAIVIMNVRSIHHRKKIFWALKNKVIPLSCEKEDYSLDK